MQQGRPMSNALILVHPWFSHRKKTKENCPLNVTKSHQRCRLILLLWVRYVGEVCSAPVLQALTNRHWVGRNWPTCRWQTAEATENYAILYSTLYSIILSLTILHGLSVSVLKNDTCDNIFKFIQVAQENHPILLLFTWSKYASCFHFKVRPYTPTETLFRFCTFTFIFYVGSVYVSHSFKLNFINWNLAQERTTSKCRSV